MEWIQISEILSSFFAVKIQNRETDLGSDCGIDCGDRILLFDDDIESDEDIRCIRSRFGSNKSFWFGFFWNGFFFKDLIDPK